MAKAWAQGFHSTLSAKSCVLACTLTLGPKARENISLTHMNNPTVRPRKEGGALGCTWST